jgi:hypothetical protein
LDQRGRQCFTGGVQCFIRLPLVVAIGFETLAALTVATTATTASAAFTRTAFGRSGIGTRRSLRQAALLLRRVVALAVPRRFAALPWLAWLPRFARFTRLTTLAAFAALLL